MVVVKILLVNRPPRWVDLDEYAVPLAERFPGGEVIPLAEPDTAVEVEAS